MDSIASKKRSNTFQFIGRKLLYDLTQKIKIISGVDSNLFLSVLTRFLLTMMTSHKLSARAGFSTSVKTQKDLKEDFLTSMTHVKDKKLKKKIIEEFDFILAFMLDGSDGEPQGEPSVMTIGMYNGMEEEEEEEKKGDKGDQKDNKRKRESTEEREEDESEKRIKRKRTDILLDDDMDDITDIVPSEIWNNIFAFLPPMRELIIVGGVNKNWSNLVKRLIANYYPSLLTKSDMFMRKFSVVSDLISTLDLSMNDKIENETLSRFVYLKDLNLRQNEKITGLGIRSLTNLEKLAIGAVWYDDLMALPNLKELIFVTDSQRTAKGWIALGHYADTNDPESIEFLAKLGVTAARGRKILDDYGYSMLSRLEILEDKSNNPLFSRLSRKLTSLVKLSVLGNHYTGWTSESIGILTNLTSLSTGDNFPLRNKDLRRLTNLTYLNIPYDAGEDDLGNMDHADSDDETVGADDYDPQGDDVDTVTKESIKKLINLETLKISGRLRLTGNIFKVLSKIKSLDISRRETLSLVEPYSDDHLLPLTSLTELNIANADFVTGKCFQYMGSNIVSLKGEGGLDSSNLIFLVPSLTRLSLPHASSLIKDRSTMNFSDIANLTNLTFLKIHEEFNTLYDGPFSAVKHVALWENLANLRSLTIHASGREDPWGLCESESINSVLASVLTNLTSLTLDWSPSTPWVWGRRRTPAPLNDACVENLTNLTSLNLSYCDFVTFQAIGTLENLTFLNWTGPINYDGFSFLPLTNLINLNEIYLKVSSGDFDYYQPFLDNLEREKRTLFKSLPKLIKIPV